MCVMFNFIFHVKRKRNFDVNTLLFHKKIAPIWNTAEIYETKTTSDTSIFNTSKETYISICKKPYFTTQ